MASKFPSFSPTVTIIFFSLCCALLLNSAHSSAIGIGYISRLLEIQDRERAPPYVQVAAARGVLRRLLPSHSSSFDFQIVSKNHPSFRRRGDPQILISGVTGVEILAGLHWYLKYWCGSHISWDKTGGAQLFSVPKAGLLSRVQDAGILVQRPVPWNYYQNAVTSSYSFAWWDWERWEKEIDWMALQGINLPLAFTGQEAIWQKVFQKFNISTSDLDDFFGGPAFLAWSRMGNLHGWGGPLPQSWFDQQLILQKKILVRMYELGMTPVLPAFSGNVPAALKTIYPSAKITRLGNCDTFDENTPPDDDPEYISSLGVAIFRGMQSGDNDGVWLMQGWLFSYDPFWRPPQMKALLQSVPAGRLVVLDLFAEVKPIWITTEQCMLHNFAGNVEMYGVLDAIASGPIDARTSENSTMAHIFHTVSITFLKVGVGMSMEGIEQNPIVYDLMSEMAFQHNKVDAKVSLDFIYNRRDKGIFVFSSS
ncbi:hypothetical protein GBA52_017475 [Prunus armeniaca]|nr:hypothetical protein GBA52_017475 [Prunus armeniaca]